MSRVPLQSVCFILLFFAQGFQTKEISRLINGFSTPTETNPPLLSKERLHKIRSYDRMKCFPRVLCTLTKADAFKQLGGVDLNKLADGYLTLLSAFPGGPDMKKPAEVDILSMILKDDEYASNYDQTSQIDQLRQAFNSGSGDSEDAVYSEEQDEDGYGNKRKKTKGRGSAGDDDEMLLTDPLLHQKEKLEVQQLMKELQEEEEENSKLNGGASSWAEKVLTLPVRIPLKIGSTILSSVVLPYLASRRRRDLSSIVNEEKDDFKIPTVPKFPDLEISGSRARTGRKQKLKVMVDPLASAMQLWRGLKDVNQCAALFPTCPFQAWEIVSMIRLVGDQGRQK